jgi:hypothetical protein
LIALKVVQYRWMDIVEQSHRRADGVAGVVLVPNSISQLPIVARAADLIDEGETVLAWFDSLTAVSVA